MITTLAVIGALAILALVFRISGIRSVEWSVKIGGDGNPPKQLK